MLVYVFFFQAEDGIRYLVRSRGLGDVYKRQRLYNLGRTEVVSNTIGEAVLQELKELDLVAYIRFCLLYTSDAADERSSVDLGGRRIIKKKKSSSHTINTCMHHQ